MGYILLVLLILNTTTAYSTFFKRKFEETLILTIVSYITTMFLTGVLGSLDIGFYIIIGANILLLGYNIYSIIKKKVSVKKQILTFGFIAFIISYLLILWISIGRKSVDWDEFSHWSLVVKNMFSLGNLGLGEESTIMCKNYLSGTSIFQFFCTKLTGEFKESMLYIGMNIIVISTIIPIFKNIKSKKSLISYICYAITFFVPMFFYPNIYRSIYVDGILALIFANTLFSYFSNYNEGLNKFKIINLMTNLALLVLIKDFGLVFAVGCIFIILVDNIFVRNKFRIKALWNNSKYILLAAVPMVLIKIIWIVTLKINNVVISSNTNGILPTMVNFIKRNLLPYQQTTVQNYVKALFETPLTIVYGFTFAMCICLAIILAYIITKNSENKKSMTVMLTLSIMGSIAYAILLMFVPYLSMFSEYEALRLASYSRYMNSYILGLIFMELAFIIKNLSDNKEKFERFVLILFLIFTLTFPFAYIEQFTVAARYNVATTINERSKFNKFNELLEKNVKNDETVYFIATNTNGAEYYIAKYEATPRKINVYSWSISNEAYSTEDIWTAIISQEEWKQNLITNFDYVYLYNIDDKFIENYGNLFYNNKEEIANNQLYRVNKTENTQSILEFVAE